MPALHHRITPGVDLLTNSLVRPSLTQTIYTVPPSSKANSAWSPLFTTLYRSWPSAELRRVAAPKGQRVDQDPGQNVLISYTSVNQPWARWIAVEPKRAGYTTVVQAFDFRPGADFVHEMQQATATAGWTIAVLSPACLGSRFAESEWRATFAKDPTGERGMLAPMRVEPCEPPPGLPATRVFAGLVDVCEPEARERLLTAVGCGHNIVPIRRAIYQREGKVYGETQARVGLHTRAELVPDISPVSTATTPTTSHGLSICRSPMDTRPTCSGSSTLHVCRTSAWVG